MNDTAPDRRSDRPDRRRAPELSVITPTYNEADNIEVLLDALEVALVTVPHEVIVVDDDSPDRTWERAERYAESHRNVRVLRRFSDHGLSSAVMAGMEASNGEVIAVIDADLQHDETALVAMVDMIRDGSADIVVGTRGAEGGSYGDWSVFRRFVSWVAAMIAKVFLRVQTSDPMSGFFAISRDAYLRSAPEVNPRGFKILLEFIGRNRDLRVGEVGYEFRNRVAGETKMSPSIIRSYLLAVFELRFGRQVKGQFFLYSLVGASGVVVNLAVFSLLEVAGVGTIDLGFSRPVRWSLLGGIAASIVWNFLLNNYFTFWEQRFHRRNLLGGLALFSAVSLLGVVIHVAVFQFLQNNGWGRSVLGPALTDIVQDAFGYVVALISNYFLNVNYIWRRRPED
ncbi:MAG TPA: glycosyltransferase family 2 protein [Microthrixaceae bacterium]|nr:glycosyltransferase family 2 protein [Microthrixaceae bacterium]